MLVNQFDETKRRECVIVKTTHSISKSNEHLYRFWEHSNTVFVEIGTESGTVQSFEIEKKKQCSQKLLRGDLLILTHCELIACTITHSLHFVK